jgi:hypothetical protein
MFRSKFVCQVLPRLWLSQNHRRFLYTEEFLGISAILQKRDLIIQELKSNQINITELRQQIQNSVLSTASTSEISVETQDEPKSGILSHDICQFILTVKSENCLFHSGEILRSHVLNSTENSPIIQKRNRMLLKDLAAMCHVQNAVEAFQPLLKVQF